jgi:hypothetical protein
MWYETRVDGYNYRIWGWHQYHCDPAIREAVHAAGEIAARGRWSADGPAWEIVGAKKDYTARAKCREHWTRLVWRGGKWQYVGGRPLRPSNWKPDERKDSVRGMVREGEIIVEYHQDGPVSGVYLAVKGGFLFCLEFGFERGQEVLQIRLPSGRILSLKNPRPWRTLPRPSSMDCWG